MNATVCGFKPQPLFLLLLDWKVMLWDCDLV